MDSDDLYKRCIDDFIEKYNDCIRVYWNGDTAFCIIYIFYENKWHKITSMAHCIKDNNANLGRFIINRMREVYNEEDGIFLKFSARYRLASEFMTRIPQLHTIDVLDMNNVQQAMIPLKDHVIDCINKRIINKDKTYMFDYGIDIPFDFNDSVSERVETIFQAFMFKDGVLKVEEYDRFRRAIGKSLLGNIRLDDNKIFVVTGDTDTGKSTFFNIIRNVVPVDLLSGANKDVVSGHLSSTRYMLDIFSSGIRMAYISYPIKIDAKKIFRITNENIIECTPKAKSNSVKYMNNATIWFNTDEYTTPVNSLEKFPVEIFTFENKFNDCLDLSSLIKNERKSIFRWLIKCIEIYLDDPVFYKNKYTDVMDELVYKPGVGIKFFEPCLFEFGDDYETESKLRQLSHS